MLSTLSLRLDGHPFGSLVHYVLDHHARPVALVSCLAEHSRNLGADYRASLLAHDTADDTQAAARVTLVGTAEPVADTAILAIQNRYLRFYPDAGQLLALGDFKFVAIRPSILRFIGGFGRIHWVSAEDYAPPANQMATAEPDIVAHMNVDHADILADCSLHYLGETSRRVSMVGIDCDGFDIRTNTRLARIDFVQSLTNANEAKAALVGMAQTARGQ